MYVPISLTWNSPALWKKKVYGRLLHTTLSVVFMVFNQSFVVAFFKFNLFFFFSPSWELLCYFAFILFYVILFCHVFWFSLLQKCIKYSWNGGWSITSTCHSQLETGQGDNEVPLAHMEHSPFHCSDSTHHWAVCRQADRLGMCPWYYQCWVQHTDYFTRFTGDAPVYRICCSVCLCCHSFHPILSFPRRLILLSLDPCSFPYWIEPCWFCLFVCFPKPFLRSYKSLIHLGDKGHQLLIIS